MRHSYQIKVRFCGECWKEKYVYPSAYSPIISSLPSVKTNRELWEHFTQNEWNKDFTLDLLPSTNDGELDCMEVMFDLTYLLSARKFIMLKVAP